MNRKAFSVEPNTAVTFSAKETITRLLPAPYPSACISSWSETKLATSSLGPTLAAAISAYDYDRDICFELCHMANALRDCGCVTAERDLFNTRYWIRRSQGNFSCLVKVRGDSNSATHSRGIPRYIAFQK